MHFDGTALFIIFDIYLYERRKASGEVMPQTEIEMANLQKNDTRLRQISMKM